MFFYKTQRRKLANTSNHPFVDGNKRIAFAPPDVFLRINGYRINQPPKLWGLIDRHLLMMIGLL